MSNMSASEFYSIELNDPSDPSSGYKIESKYIALTNNPEPTLFDGTSVNRPYISTSNSYDADLIEMFRDASGNTTRNNCYLYSYVDDNGQLQYGYTDIGTEYDNTLHATKCNAYAINSDWEVNKLDYVPAGCTLDGEDVTVNSDTFASPEEIEQFTSLIGVTPSAGNALRKLVYTDEAGATNSVYYLTGEVNDVTGFAQYGKMYTVQGPDYYMLGNTVASKYDSLDLEQAVALNQIRHDYPELADVPDNEMYVYFKNGKMCFSTKADLDECMASGARPGKEPDFEISSDIDYQHKLKYYYAGNITQQIVEKAYALMDDASGSGRFSTIKLENMSEPFYLKSEEVTDEKSYNDAMNQYNYNLTQYEKAMADINAKTKLIQEQDRTLELRLKQLETEQKAVSTEIDAVKGIIKSNIDASFKTFS